MKALYKAGFKLYIRYIDGVIEIADGPKAAKNMLKRNKRQHFKDVDIIQYVKYDTICKWSINYVQKETI